MLVLEGEGGLVSIMVLVVYYVWTLYSEFDDLIILYCYSNFKVRGRERASVIAYDNAIELTKHMLMVIYMLCDLKVESREERKCDDEERWCSRIKRASQNISKQADDYETNDTYFKGGGNTEYTQGNDGKVYETDMCSMCKGTGIEENRSTFSDEAGRICPMCDGKGVRSY